MLNGARHITLAGHFAYIAADAGPGRASTSTIRWRPRVAAVLPLARRARLARCSSATCWSTDGEGLEGGRRHPPRARRGWSQGAAVPLADARRIYVARTYAYVAAGARGPGRSSTSTSPSAPALYTTFTADGTLNDAERRGRRHHQRLAVRLRRRRPERAEGAPADLARQPAQLLRLQPGAEAAS